MASLQSEFSRGSCRSGTIVFICDGWSSKMLGFPLAAADFFFFTCIGRARFKRFGFSRAIDEVRFVKV